MPAETLSMQRRLEALTGLLTRAVTHRFGKSVKEMRGTLGEVLVERPAQVSDGPIKVVFQHALERPAERALLRAQGAVEIDAVLHREMLANEGGIAQPAAVIFNIGNFAL